MWYFMLQSHTLGQAGKQDNPGISSQSKVSQTPEGVEKESITHLPKKTVCIVHPLVYKLRSDRLWVMRKPDVLQSVQKELRVVVEGSNGNLETHGAELAGFNPSR